MFITNDKIWRDDVQVKARVLLCVVYVGRDLQGNICVYRLKPCDRV